VTPPPKGQQEHSLSVHDRLRSPNELFNERQHRADDETWTNVLISRMSAKERIQKELSHLHYLKSPQINGKFVDFAPHEYQDYPSTRDLPADERLRDLIQDSALNSICVPSICGCAEPCASNEPDVRAYMTAEAMAAADVIAEKTRNYATEEHPFKKAEQKKYNDSDWLELQQLFDRGAISGINIPYEDKKKAIKYKQADGTKTVLTPCVTMIVRKMKTLPIQKAKSRLVIDGGRLLRKYPNMFPKSDTYAPTVDTTTILFLAQFASRNNKQPWQIDFKNAFAQSREKTVRYATTIHASFRGREDTEKLRTLLQTPTDKPTPTHLVFHAVMYGLPTAPRRWHDLLKSKLVEQDFLEHSVLTGLFWKPHPRDPNRLVFLAVHVDDVFCVATHDEDRDHIMVHLQLGCGLEATPAEPADYFTGIHFSKMPSGAIQMDLQDYTEAMLSRLNHHEPVLRCQYNQLPGQAAFHRSLEPPLPEHELKRLEETYGFRYSSAVGSCVRLLIIRHDLRHSVSTLAAHTMNPREEHFKYMSHFLSYIGSHKTDPLCCDPPWKHSDTRKLTISSCSDAELGHNKDGKCIFSYAVSLDRMPILMATSKTASCPNDTCYAEAIGANKMAVATMFWLRCLQECRIIEDPADPPVGEGDNMSVINVITQSTGFPQIKAASHIRLKLCYLHGLQMDGLMKFVHLNTDLNFSDLGTKTLARFKNAIFACRVLNLPPHLSSFIRLFHLLDKASDKEQAMYNKMLIYLFPEDHEAISIFSRAPATADSAVPPSLPASSADSVPPSSSSHPVHARSGSLHSLSKGQPISTHKCVDQPVHHVSGGPSSGVPHAPEHRAPTGTSTSPSTATCCAPSRESPPGCLPLGPAS